MPFDDNGFRKPTRLPVLESGLLLKDKFFVMCPEVDPFDVAIKVDCGYTCSEELNMMLVITVLVPPISLWSFLSFVLTITGVLVWIGERYTGTFLPMVDTWRLLPDFPDMTSKPCRLGPDETSGMQKDWCWEYLISDKILQILLGKVSNRSSWKCRDSQSAVTFRWPGRYSAVTAIFFNCR